MGLKERALKMNAGKGIEFMEGRTLRSCDDIMDQEVTIRDFDFLSGDQGEYVVFIIDEDKDSFFFGSSILTDNLKKLEAEGFYDSIVSEGLPTILSKKKSKNKRTYVSVEFFHEEEK